MRRNNSLRTTLAVAAVTALLGACSDNSADADDKADPTPSSSADPTEESSAPTEEADLPDGVVALPERDPGADFATLTAGRYRIPLDDTLSFDVDIEEETYAHDGGIFLATGPVVLKTELAGEAYGVPGDPCTDHTIEPVGPTTTDIVEAIRDQPAYQVTNAKSVDLGGAEGTYLEIRIPADYDASGCEEDGTVVVPANPATAIGYEPGHRSRWWILDVDGRRVVVQQNCACSAEAFDRTTEVARSITFTSTS